MTHRARRVLADHLSPEAQNSLTTMTATIAADPAAVQRLFPVAAREVARGPLDDADPDGITGPRLEDAVRTVLLTALTESERDPAARLRQVNDLYRFGDGDEKRAVLRALDQTGLGSEVQPLVEDALRTNDVRLVAAAMGTWAGEHLDEESWRQGVLKCMFLDLPVVVVHRLSERADARLAEMVAAYAHERLAAGRPLPRDAPGLLALFPQVLGQFPDVAAAVSAAPES